MTLLLPKSTSLSPETPVTGVVLMGSQKELKNAKRASNVGAKAKRSKVSFSDFRFVRIELTEAEKSTFKSLLESGEFDPIPLDDWISRGLKLSVSGDGENGTVLASLTVPYADMHDAGCVLTARGRDAITALAVLCYKDSYLAGEGGWRQSESERGGGYSDIG